jgi:hypothetical protein
MDENWNFCGMSKTSIAYYKHYRETVNKLTARGFGEDFVYEHFTEGPDRVIASVKDDETRVRLLEYVAHCLERKEKVTEGDLRGTIKAWHESETGKCQVTPDTSTRSEKLTNVNKKAQSVPESPKEPQDEKPKEPLKIEPDGKPEQHVNPGPAVMVNPVFTPDTLRQSPFRNGNEIKAHDADPLGIGPAPADPVPSAPAEKIDPAKELKERRNRLAKELAATYSERTQRDIQDLIHENPTWRNEEADVFYFGIEALRNPPKISAAPAKGRA